MKRFVQARVNGGSNYDSLLGKDGDPIPTMKSVRDSSLALLCPLGAVQSGLAPSNREFLPWGGLFYSGQSFVVAMVQVGVNFVLLREIL